jgi:DNA repair protein RAD7
MSRNRVRGPSSALSSFLRERGIEAPRNVFERVPGAADQQGGATATAATANSDQIATPTADETQDPANLPSSSHDALDAPSTAPNPLQKRKRGPAKTKKKTPESEDELDINPKKRKQPLKKANPLNLTHVRFCERCQRRFLDLDESAFCTACLTIGASANPSKASKHAAKKREMQAYQLTGESKVAVLPLRDLCINLVAEYIDDLDQLGFLPPNSKRQISMIISRQRKLDGKTLQLFLGQDEDTIELFDCTSTLVLI